MTSPLGYHVRPEPPPAGVPTPPTGYPPTRTTTSHRGTTPRPDPPPGYHHPNEHLSPGYHPRYPPQPPHLSPGYHPTTPIDQRGTTPTGYHHRTTSHRGYQQAPPSLAQFREF